MANMTLSEFDIKSAKSSEKMSLSDFGEALIEKGYQETPDLRNLIKIAKEKPITFFSPDSFLLMELELHRRDVFYTWCEKNREAANAFLRLAEEEYLSGALPSSIHYIIQHPLIGSTQEYTA